MAVLRDDAGGVELDEPECEPLTVHDAARDSLPDLLRLNLAGFFEGAQGAIVPRSATPGTISPQSTFTFYAFVGFVAGFSERFTHVIFGEAELTVAEALGAAPSGRDSKKPEEPPPVDNPDDGA